MAQIHNATKQKSIKILWIYSGEIHKIFMSYSPDFHGQNWVQPMKIPLKKPWKYFEKFPIDGPRNSLDYKKCNEKHMKKPWLFFYDS